MNEVLIQNWLDWLEGGQLSPATISLRRILIWTFARHHDLATAQPGDVMEHLATRPGGAWSKASHLATLRSFYRYSVRAGLVDHDPTLLVHPIRTPAGRQEPVPPEVLADALAHANDRTRLMLLLGSRAGLRRAEIAGLHSRDISDTHLTITGKGQRTRRIPIHPDLRPYLKGVDGWVFPSRKFPGEHLGADHVGALIEEAIAPWTAHSLRRYFATAAYRATHDVESVRELLGHSSVATTSRYVRASDSDLTAAVLAVA